MNVTLPIEPARPATYEDLRALPDNLIGEILEGELVASPRPRNRHANATCNLYGELRGPYSRGIGGPGGWLFLIEPEIRLDRDVLVPDIAGWRWERVPPAEAPEYFSVPPDWVCEVLSPTTVRHDRSTKLRIYRRNGVGHVWMIDPVSQTLETYRRSEEGWLLLETYDGEVAVAAPPFEDVPFSLDSLWLPDR